MQCSWIESEESHPPADTHRLQHGRKDLVCCPRTREFRFARSTGLRYECSELNPKPRVWGHLNELVAGSGGG